MRMVEAQKGQQARRLSSTGEDNVENAKENTDQDKASEMESAMANADLGRYRRIVQMFWDPEPSNDTVQDQPVWCLGQQYRLHSSYAEEGSKTEAKTTKELDANQSKPLAIPHGNRLPETPPESATSSFSYTGYGDADSESGWPQAFLSDFESRFWMTYRSEFDPIPKSTDPRATSALSFHMRLKCQLGDGGGFSSDSGWGCMIRSGQSLLANAIGMVDLGRDWRRGQKAEAEREILRTFADDPTAPYSIHNFVQHGASACGKYPGEWFGPSATAQCIQALVNGQASNLRVYSTGDGPDVYEDSFMKTAKSGDGVFKPTLILIGTRLGIDKITPVYWEALISALQMPQSVGIAGGRPSSSHYFVGAQGSFLLYIDPHHTRAALPYRQNINDYTEEEIDSCHTSRLRRLHVREMDPSMLIGFLIRSDEDWLSWRRGVNHVQGKAIIHVADSDPLCNDRSDGRASAVDEVETLSDDDTDTVVVES